MIVHVFCIFSLSFLIPIFASQQLSLGTKEELEVIIEDPLVDPAAVLLFLATVMCCIHRPIR